MNILGFNYTLDNSGSQEDIGAMGKFQYGISKIQIANKITPEQEESTVIHEIIEALNMHLEMGLEHRVISGLEAGLYQVLKENGVNLQPLLKELRK